MGERTDEHTREQGKAVKRRGILAAAGAVVAGIAAQRASQPVGATSGGGPDGPLVMGSNFGSGVSPNTVSRLTLQVPTGTWSGSTAAMFGVDAAVAGNAPADTTALYAVGKGGGAGLIGTTGITPTNVTALNAGVHGLGSAGKNGVYGLSDAASGIGVIGKSGAGVGVKGVSDTGSPLIGQAVALWNTNAGALGIGTAGPGVQGQSSTGHGLIGYTTATDGHAALIGYAQAAGSVGLIGVAPGNAGHWAGVFYGDVQVNGTSSAPVAGTAALHPDGTRRLLQGVASPEGWFEDFGAGTLVNGTAEVKLDPEFAALVDTSTLHVFAMPEGPLHLHVSQKGPVGFTVVGTPLAVAGGPKAPTQAPGGGFAWRVVAKRKEGGAARLAKLAATPALKPVTPITVPEAPTPNPPATKGADTMPGGGTP
jgi:hypothetical protein